MQNNFELKEHQKRVATRLSNPDQQGLLLYWNLGSGKTLGAINAANLLKANSTVVVPASLQENFKKEVKKSGSNPKKFDIMSYDKLVGGKNLTKTDLLILDEIHRIRNSSTRRAKTIEDVSQNFNKVIGLTGTPIQNKPHEIAPIINAIKGQEVFPTDEKEFNKKYLHEQMLVPSAWDRYIEGKQPTRQFSIKNKKEFRNNIKGLVDYYNTQDPKDYPSVAEQVVNVPMTDDQINLYNYYERKLPKSLRNKMQQMIPPTKQEARALNSFISASRQLSNTPEAFTTGKNPVLSPKIKAIVENITKDNESSFVYSNYLSSGIMPISEELNKRHLPHGVFHGGLSSKDKNNLVKSFNSGKIKILLASGSGSEGIDLKGVRKVLIEEPAWNDPRIEQVIGRAVRYRSHSNLPESERNVKVYKYVSKFPDPDKSILTELGLKSDKSNRYTADEYLYNLSARKKKINNLFLNELKQEGSK